MRLLFLILILLTGCSSIQKWAVRRSSPVFHQAADQLTKEDSWVFFRNSAPGNLKFLELVYLTDPDNMGLLPAVIKAHTGYAYAVPETLAFEDELIGRESENKSEAILHYTRAQDYGVVYLGKQDISRDDLLTLPEEKLREKLKKETNDDDLVAMVYMAQSWGSLINLQKDNVALVSQIPRVKILFDHVCSRKPEIENGICDIFMAQYEASRPRMLGGNPEKAKELYNSAMRKYPHHLLIPLNMIQYIHLPAMDTDAYEIMASHMKTELAEWGSKKRDNLKDETRYRNSRDLNLYNAVAKKRLEIIEQNKKKIF
ncbi:MAG: TRAP transporter TatT component family protein [Bdellovibrionota bacterium]